MERPRTWVENAISRIEADFNRSADTHLLRVPIPGTPGIHLYLKDESTHPTGSLKHRLARSLFLYGLCNGWIDEHTTIIEASSGSTAVSEAYFARFLGLPFIAVMPKVTSREKIALIQFYGGRCHLVDDPARVYEESQRLAVETGGRFMDQFTYAERATDWRGNNNIAESIFGQMAEEEHPVPRWIVCGAGTGGTSATMGRFIRYRRHPTGLCVVDPENSVFFDFYQSGAAEVTCRSGSRIEGIGRPRVEPSLVREVIDRMIQVPDAASFAAVRMLELVIGRRCGSSTGTNLCGTFHLMAEMKRRGETGSIVTLICDSGERYLQTCYNETWLKENNLDISPWLQRLRRFHDTGEWDPRNFRE